MRPGAVADADRKFVVPVSEGTARAPASPYIPIVDNTRSPRRQRVSIEGHVGASAPSPRCSALDRRAPAMLEPAFFVQATVRWGSPPSIRVSAAAASGSA